VLKILDKDTLKSDDIAGSMLFRIEEYFKIFDAKENFPIFWKNLYGSPTKGTGKYRDLMDHYPEYASKWKGRILMQVCMEETDTPTMKIWDADEKAINAATTLENDWQKFISFKLQNISAYPWSISSFSLFGNNSTSPRTCWRYQILFEVSQGICLQEEKQYRVMLKIGEFELLSEKPIYKTWEYWFWNFKKLDDVFEAPYPDVESMERIYIYLMDGDLPVSYWKGMAKDFTDPNAQFKWVSLIADKSIKKITKPHKAGIISFRLTINDVYKNNTVDISSLPEWNAELPSKTTEYLWRAYIFQCKDLPPSDENGSWDPYVKVWSPGKKSFRTSIVEKSINPIFYETVEFPFIVSSLDYAPPFVLYIKDNNRWLFRNYSNFVGRAIIPYKEASLSTDFTSEPHPKKHPIKMGFSPKEPIMGEILVSFAIIPIPTFSPPIPPILSPQTDLYKISINILGLRNLQSSSILPVKKPIITFNIKSLLPAEKASTVENISTDPSATGPHPTISTVISFNAHLPRERIFCPSLSWFVYDSIFHMFKSMLGSFVIDIGELIAKKKKEMAQEEENITCALNVIREKIKDYKAEKELIRSKSIEQKKIR
jgi:hypothetical protein